MLHIRINPASHLRKINVRATTSRLVVWINANKGVIFFSMGSTIALLLLIVLQTNRYIAVQQSAARLQLQLNDQTKVITNQQDQLDVQRKVLADQQQVNRQEVVISQQMLNTTREMARLLHKHDQQIRALLGLDRNEGGKDLRI